MSSATKDRPAADVDRRWLVLVVVATAQLMVVLDSTVVNIALPSAQRALGFPNGDRQWVVTAYALAFGSLLLVGGRLGDMYSRKWVFITGLAGFAVSSAIGGAAVSFEMLVAARALQGAFGAILAPSALGTLVSTFQDPRERGRAFGVFGSVAAGGGGVGLILGGLLTQYLSWRWTLYVNLVFAAIAVAGALAYMSSARPASRPRMDWTGAVLACAGLFLIVFGFSHAETAGWTAGLTIGSLVLGLVLLAAFVVAERRGSHPLLPLHVILDRTRGGSYVAVGLSGIAIFAVFLFLTFYLQVVKGYSPLTSGLVFLPMIACILLSSNLSSIVALPRVGPRVLIATGMLFGLPDPAHRDLHLRRRHTARPDHHGPRLRHDLLPGHQHGHGRRRAPGLGRGLRPGQHHAAGRGFDRDGRAEHHRADRDDQLPRRAPHGTASAGHRGHPRLHHGLRGVRGNLRSRCDPRDHPAAIQAAAGSTQGRGRS
jgi:MFS family permease